eukprot:5015485-Pyramimonas_sp.AAC.1
MKRESPDDPNPGDSSSDVRGNHQALEGRTRDASSTKRGIEKLLATTAKVPGTATRDKTAEPRNIREKNRHDFDISTPPGTPDAQGICW